MKVNREGRPEYIPVALTFETRNELDCMLAILRYASKEKVLGGSTAFYREAREFEDLLLRVYS